ncbi:MAG: efflux RND transporter periplasmic adaptor subunit [Alphaproteobacteria bacterium]|nr:efflux RND transporter periplasmic adaptor subunit [Alphaproteobacteria bacterium]MBU1514012.1 efflux RND transporter periplasmic adaptor subunit [Alphaproteobacteria bacterium]MBU2093048.1 efflux RND transporter periplasmic adaptor subunit [Alphaproteobacteria bacterium]MBU2151749.1 efflux RND transporter periplasmic adaptor subunit [Alphaproteobacteria bacterium]MBU2309431.1 efflux RND transporter periplasmic adaptor subunit [Alphaproteobacteria bacterium]
MRLKSQYVFIIVLVGVVVLFFLVRGLFGGDSDKAQAKAPAANPTPSVQAKLTPETVREVTVAIRGRTEAARTVVVRSETAGVVAAAPTLEGSFVREGQVLCRLAVDARQASLDQARAALKSRQLQRKAAAELAAKGYRSETQVLEAQANLDQAMAGVRAAEIALKQVEIRAPFAGVFDKRDAEVGTYLSPGQPCGTMIELNPMLVVGDAPETEAGRLRAGALASARLVDGHMLTGRVRYVARDADPQTRTYRVEATVPNPGNAVRSGLSADLRIAAGAGAAHLVPVSALVLDSAGRQGVRHVLASGVVAFAPVTVLEETSQGMWVSGLKGSINVITVGQSFVADGQKVRVAQVR